MYFPISGVECPVWLPPAVSFVIASAVTSAGVSGAFLILPFQMSVLGFTSPAVSATNLLYNVVAIPGGVLQYIREGRMAWPIAWVTLVGTLPGIFVGAVLRIRYFPGAREAKFFVGLVLAWLGVRLILDFHHRVFGKGIAATTAASRLDARFAGKLPADAVVRTRKMSLTSVEYEFWGEVFRFSPLLLAAVSLAVGVVGGIYGIGGGAIIAPFIASVFQLPVYTIAGACLFGTFVTSIAGTLFFELLSRLANVGGVPVGPDWLLGILFGVGGLVGTNVGARLQKYLPERWIRLVLGSLVIAVAVQYIWQFFA